MVKYLIASEVGLNQVNARNDGYTINLNWFKAYPSRDGYDVAYHIYFSTEQKNIFNEGVKYVSIDGSTEVDIINLTPGQLYYFCVRPVEYNPVVVNFNNLPEAFNGLKVYPESLLRQDISATDLLIPLVDAETFPDYGVVQIGVELIQYLSVDRINNNLVLLDELERGFNNTQPRIHTTDGYDGYRYWNPLVRYVAGKEDLDFDNIYPGQCRFDYDHYASNEVDGYYQINKDLLTTDLTASDEYNVDFPSYDYDGWHRTDPVLLLKGECVGSYLSGEQFCADDQNGIGRMLRGISLQDRILQRQEYLLSLTGEPVVLIRRQRTGIVCSCVLPTSTYPDDRCPKCFGTKFVMGWEQYFNPRRSDGRILVRFSPADEDLKMMEGGLESELNTDCWTMTVPSIKDRDILIRFDMDGNEEFRYEVMSVSRNRTLFGLEGAQKMRVQRIRKYDVAYQISAFRNTSTEPVKYSTNITNANRIGPHKHDIVISNVTEDKMGQLTSVVLGHNHVVRWDSSQQKLVVEETLGHTHELIL